MQWDNNGAKRLFIINQRRLEKNGKINRYS